MSVLGSSLRQKKTDFLIMVAVQCFGYSIKVGLVLSNQNFIKSVITCGKLSPGNISEAFPVRYYAKNKKTSGLPFLVIGGFSFGFHVKSGGFHEKWRFS